MEIYVSKLAETEFSNPNYRSENLKVNLEKTFSGQEKFRSFRYFADKLLPSLSNISLISCQRREAAFFVRTTKIISTYNGW
jgi:hypothetical protein